MSDATGNDEIGNAGIDTADHGGIGQQPSPRKRGRPSNAELAARRAASGNDGGADTIDPAAIGSGDTAPGAGTGEGRKRGRPRGTGNAKKAAVSVEAIAALLIGAELLAATKTGVEEFALSEKQNKELAAALGNVYRHFPQIGLTEKQQDIAALVYVSANIFFEQKAAYKKRVSGNV